jgi:hypothetical protein
MFRPLRSLLGLALLIGLVWCSFHVRLGPRTFAEHVDNIGASPEARELVDGARGTVEPVIEEATHRVLGEHVEAPTTIGGDAFTPAAGALPARPRRAGDEAPRRESWPPAR